ncbi:MAG: hypothetical protein O2973_09680 [Gemmatimonadetes bacterium]|nr:hypothetical protein [Gemmatimonadota bacterium]
MRPTDLIAVFAPRFDAAGIEWMIAGGVASIVYGEPRLTQDLDVVAGLKKADAERFALQFPEPEFYCAPAEVIAEEAGRDASGHFNVLHNPTGARADIYLAGRDPLARRGLDGRRVVELLGRPTPIAAPEYVILHKLRFRQQGASERHLRDIRAMLRVLGSSVDVAALTRDAADLGLSDVWREMEGLRE